MAVINQGELLRLEILRIGLNQSQFAKLAGINRSVVNKRLNHTDNFTLADILHYGNIIQKNGGNPSNVWENYKEITKQTSLSDQYEDDPESVAKITHGAIFLYENNLKHKTREIVSCPLFDDCNLCIRSYDEALRPLYSPGQIFFLKHIDSIQLMAYGPLYYLKTDNIETFRIIKPGKRPDSCVLQALNPDYPDQEIFIESIISLYLVKGRMERIG